MKIPYTINNVFASKPTRANPFDAGYDLYAADSYTVEPGKRQLIKTGISVAIPEGYYGRVAPRSGLAYKHGIDVLAGVIDATYRGDIGVILQNLGNAEFKIAIGDRVAQLIIERCYEAEWELTDKLPDTVRGAGGFGSTGT